MSNNNENISNLLRTRKAKNFVNLKNLINYKKPNLVKLKILDLAKVKTFIFCKANSFKIDFFISKVKKTFIHL